MAELKRRRVAGMQMPNGMIVSVHPDDPEEMAWARALKQRIIEENLPYVGPSTWAKVLTEHQMKKSENAEKNSESAEKKENETDKK